VLASDVTHFYENMDAGPTVHHGVPCRRDAGRVRHTARQCTNATAHRPGPRPRGDASLSAAEAGAGGIVVRLDVAPNA